MMKTNKWTMALAAAGVVSLGSVAQAQEAAAGAEALAASTTLSGYVSTSYTLRDGDGTAIAKSNATSKTAKDSFALDVVSLTLASAQGAGEYATGYTVGMWIGPDDQGSTGGNDFELTQANIDLRLPIGNGIDLKVGYMPTIVGYETWEYTDNAFFQRGLGFSVEPTHHTGLLASYQLTDSVGVTVGLVNDSSDNTANNVGGTSDGTHSFAGAISYTLPDSLGPLGGAGLNGATLLDYNGADYWYASASIPLPMEGLSLDVAADWVDYDNGNDDEIYQVYLSYAVSDATTLNIRYEQGTADGQGLTDLDSVAIGVTHDLWENVTSRVEWMSTSEEGVADDDTFAINLVYSF